MKRSRTVHIGATLAAALSAYMGLAACAVGEPEYQEVCVNEQLDRVEDEKCPQGGNNGGGQYHWYYIPGHSYVPPVGAKAYGGSTSRPSSGSITRGGFGGTRAGAGT